MRDELKELAVLWERTIGDPPPATQFETWNVLHSVDVMKTAIIATAKKNLKLSGTMTEDHRVRYCSSVMNMRETRIADNVTNRIAVAAEQALKAVNTLNAAEKQAQPRVAGRHRHTLQSH